MTRWILAGAAAITAVASISLQPWGQSDTDPLPPQPRVIPKAHAWERAQWHVQKRLPEGADRLAPDALEKARKQRTLMARSDAAKRYRERFPEAAAKAAPAWQSLGPTEKGGRTRRIVMDSEGTMYASGVSGGVWRLDGSRWTPLGDRLANLNVGALAISPADDRVMYAGTGELYRRTLRPYANMTGAGMFKSTNGGEDWVQLETTLGDDFLFVSDIVISPDDPQRLYAATNSGIWRSDDGGVSFVQTLSNSDQSGQIYEGCTDLDLREDAGTDWLLATCSSRSTDDRYYLPGLLPRLCSGGACSASVYLNTDAAGSDDWNVVLNEPGMGRTSLDIFDGDGNIVYALSASVFVGPDKTGDGRGDYQNGLHAVFRSDDGGQTWSATLRNTDPDPVSTWMLSFAWQARSDGITPYGAGWYNQAIEVDPDDPDTVWVGGMQLYRSTDGGQLFSLLSNYYGSPNVGGSSGPYMHPDIHTLVFDEQGTLWIGNDGGVWRARNQDAPGDRVNDGYRSLLTGGASFDPVVSNFTTTQFYHGVVSADGQLVIGGMQDNGSDVLGLPGFGSAWVEAFGGDGSYSAYDPDGPFYYFSAQNAYIGRMDGNLNFSYPGDAIQAAAATNDDFIFITPFLLDPSNRSRIYLAGKRLYRSQDRGDSWTVASGAYGFAFQDKGNAIAIAPTRPNRVMVGTGRAIFKHEPAATGGSGTAPSSVSPRRGWVSSLTFDPRDAEVVYATYSTFGGDHVWKSEDAGDSFFPIDGEGEGRLPDIPVHSLAVDPTDSDSLYVGTDVGVFFTRDGGITWQVEEGGFGGTIVERVTVNQPETSGTAYLFAFTYGRGVWRVPLAEVDGQPAYAISPDVNGFWFDADEPGHGIQVQVIEAGGQLSVLVTWYVYHQGEPLWLIGVGPVNGDRATVPMTLTGGTGFGDEFDTDDVIRAPWGNLELVFQDETELLMRWQSPLLGESGTLTMDHLSQPVSIAVDSSPVGLCSTGVYWNPAQDGHGIVAETIMLGGEPGFAWSWFNYRDGNQLWLVGTAPFDGNLAVSEAFVGNVGEFPPAFTAATAEVESWGTVTFEFDTERTFTLTWAPVNQPESAGSLAFEQLSTIAGSSCL